MRVPPLLMAGVLVASLACGTGSSDRSVSPTSPSPSTPSAAPPPLPAGAVLTIVSGDTGQPVSSAVVTVGSKEYASDAAGRVTLGESAAAGTLLSIDASGFLDRRTVVRSSSDTQFSLWPRASPTGLTELFTSVLVYGCGRFPLARIGDDRVSISLSDELATDAAVLEAHRKAADLMTTATEGRIAWQLEGCSSTPCVRVVIGGTAQGSASMTRDMNGYVTGGTISFRDLEHARRFDIALHEMGHNYGLGHADGNIIMCGDGCGSGPCAGPLPIAEVGQFTPQERLAMKLVLQRRPGNVFPDSDRGVTTPNHATSLPVSVACSFER